MSRTDERRGAIVTLYQMDLTGKSAVDLIKSSKREREVKITRFSRDLIAGVTMRRAEIDRQIDEHAIGWSLDRIAPLERCVLRTALYEMEHRTDVPVEVAIDEAVEFAKRYCGTDAPGFVNGILGAVAREQSSSDDSGDAGPRTAEDGEISPGQEGETT